ncbi:ketoisovalerate reductase [Nemania diffusa]|nr:ketoisovalerate reductase [Nemania diffusa]
MRVSRPSMTLAFTLRYQFTGFRGSQMRLLQSSACVRNMKNQPEIGWLRRLLEDNIKPQKLYAWTPKHLLGHQIEPLSGTCVHATTEFSRGNDEDEHRRIYILGVGNIGRLYAMCLSKIPNGPPITLVVQRRKLLENWAANPGIELERQGQVHRSTDFDIEWWSEEAPPGNPAAAEVAGGRSIGNLIVATKAADAMPTVDRVRRYLGGASTVAFTQNGMCRLWPPHGAAYVRARFPDGDGDGDGAGAGRPGWVACVTTHGVKSVGQFQSIHASPADALVGPVMPGDGGEERMGYLMRQIADAPDLDARQVSREGLWVAQLEKLVVNAIINPLTAVLRCKNGEIFVARDDALPAVIDKLLREASDTLGALILDPRNDEVLLSEAVSQGAVSEGLEVVESLKASREQLLERFSFPQLRKMVLDVGAKVGENTSSMLQDVRGGKWTEIHDLNGWLVDTAKLLDKGLRLPTHEKLISLVRSNVKLKRDELCANILGEDHC